MDNKNKQSEIAEENLQAINEVLDEKMDEPQIKINGQNQVELVVSLTNLINSNLSEISNIEAEIAKTKEMIDSVLSNDKTYMAHAEAAKEALRVKTNTKKEIFKRPEVRHVVEKLNELKANLADTKEELSNYIQEYASASGQNYFEAEDGTIQEIVYVAKLRKKAV